MAGKAWAECEAAGHAVRRQRAVSADAPLTSSSHGMVPPTLRELLPTPVT